ncbi:MAG: LysR family transcriptional regulator [Pseudohongiellaceae bacterium]
MHVQHRGLRTFCTAAELLSFKDAANELCLTASAVSHQISGLEQDLGTKLFQRKTRSLSLTNEGSHLFEEIRPYLDAIDQALATVKSISGKERLLIQMPEFFASELLIPKIGDFSAKHQQIDLRIESMETSETINPKADINIVLSQHKPPATFVKKLFPIRYIPACSRTQFEQWQKSNIEPVDALESATVLLHKARPNAWSQWARHAGVSKRRTKQIIFVDSMFALARAAEKKVGVALVPMPVSKTWFETGALVPLHKTDLVTKDCYWMILNENSKDNESVEVLWNWIAEMCKKHE